MKKDTTKRKKGIYQEGKGVPPPTPSLADLPLHLIGRKGFSHITLQGKRAHAAPNKAPCCVYKEEEKD